MCIITRQQGSVLFAQVDEARIGMIRLLIPRPESLDWVATAIAGGAAFALFRLKIGLLWTLAGAAAAGLIFHRLFGG